MTETLMDLDTLWHELAPMMLAILCGAVIGLEREMRGKPSGVKTSALICFGCAAFASTGTLLLGAGQAGDPSRVLGQIVTGIGFLGAGAIMTYHGHIMGMTTAATIWVTAAVGSAIGLGWYSRGILWTVLCIFVLQVLGFAERKYLSNGKKHNKAAEEPAA